MKTPVVAIIGRPNVGKSTLFNAVLGYKKAIVEDSPGVTRDRHYALVERFAIPFLLVDTGGFDTESADELGSLVLEQTFLALEEADIVLALFDGNAGLQHADSELVSVLRRGGKRAFFAVNKCDGVEQVQKAAEFYALGLEQLFDISALYGRGVRELVESALRSLEDFESLAQQEAERRERLSLAEREAEAESLRYGAAETEEEEGEEERYLAQPAPEIGFAPVFLPQETTQNAEEYDRFHKLLPLPPRTESRHSKQAKEAPVQIAEVPQTIGPIRVALIGRPNVGKSTLFNALVGEPRAITSEVAGTTRDSLDIELHRGNQDFVLVDTAGLRKKGRVSDTIERYSVMRALSAISDCDVAVLLLDAQSGPTDQDAKIAGLVCEQGRGLVLAVNKWDLVPKTHRTVREYTLRVRDQFKFAPFAPLLFLTARSGRRALRVLAASREVAVARMQRVTTGVLNRVLQQRLKSVVPPSYRGRPIKLFFANQVDVAPPTFILFFNYPEHVHFSYFRAIKNIIREELGFEGTDVKLIARERVG